MAMHVGYKNHIPAILLNPSFLPDIRNGDCWKIDADAVSGGQWIVLQNLDDDYLDPSLAINFAIKHNRPIKTFDTGGHRFNNLYDAINTIIFTANQLIT
jgi:hypothetical protein